MRESAWVHVDGKQWGVGHGGFHTETISLSTRAGDEQLRFIFDCGTTSGKDALNKAIKSYISELKHDALQGSKTIPLGIDALYISHFDLDHISGIKELIAELKKAKIKIKSVYAPLLSTFEKLSLASHSLFGTGMTGSSVQPYINLIIDPVSWFQEEADIPQGSIHLLSGNPGPYDGPDTGLGDAAADSAIPTKKVSPSGSITVKAARLKLWLCIPFVRDGKFSLATYSGAIKKLRELINSHESGSITVAELKTLLKDHRTETQQIIKNQVLPIYNKAKGRLRITDTSEMNFTSLCLYSGPNPDISEYEYDIHQRFSIFDNTLWTFDLSHLKCSDLRMKEPIAGWFATGDADFTNWQSQNWISKTPNRKLLYFVDVINMPHHGSRKNSDAAFWTLFPNTQYAVFNGNGRYGLPNVDIVAGAYLHNKDVFKTTASNGFRHRILLCVAI